MPQTYRIIRKQVIGEMTPGKNGARFETQALRMIADFLDDQDKQGVRARKLSSTDMQPLSEHFEAWGPDGSAIAIGMGQQAYTDEGEPMIRRDESQPMEAPETY